jgi:hypothetical protein
MVVHKMSFWSQLNPTWQQVQLRYKHNCMYQKKKNTALLFSCLRATLFEKPSCTLYR